jgi:hypothetical protein
MPEIVPLPGGRLATQAQASLWETERIHRRLDALEARLEEAAAASQPSAGTATARTATARTGRFLSAMAAMGVAALVLIAGSLAWQVTHPVPPGTPTMVVNAPPPVTQGAAPSGMQAAARMPSFRSPGILLPPHPALRAYYPRG